MNNIRSYSVETIKPDKRPAIWVVVEPNVMIKLAMLQKPGWLPDDKWEQLLKKIRIDIPNDFLKDVE